MAPGLWLQKLTTREPDDDQLEVAFAALKAVLPVKAGREAQDAEGMIDQQLIIIGG